MPAQSMAWEQKSLFPQPLNNEGFSDPNFSKNKCTPIHRWVPWIAGFSSDFVSHALKRFLSKPGVVCDPFAGVGTTLLEAVLAGHSAVGFEINPYASFACQVKLNSCKIRPETLQDKIAEFQQFFHSCGSDYEPSSIPPPGFKTRSPFYSPEVLRKVLISLDFTNSISHRPLQNLFRIAFAATMVQYSNYTYEPSLARRISSGKPEIFDYPVDKGIISKLEEMVNDIKWYRKKVKPTEVNVQNYNLSFFDHPESLEPASVDLVITSPPYLNNYHYNRNTRPQMYWLGFADNPSELNRLEQLNFGKFWQTVRDLDIVHLDFDLPDCDLSLRLEELGKLNPEKGVYGGRGWANYAACYFNDCYRLAGQLARILKPAGNALIVLGNSILQGVPIPTDHYFAAIARLHGLELIELNIPRKKRNGNSIIDSNVRVGKAEGKASLYEAVVHIRNTGSSV